MTGSLVFPALLLLLLFSRDGIIFIWFISKFFWCYCQSAMMGSIMYTTTLCCEINIVWCITAMSLRLKVECRPSKLWQVDLYNVFIFSQRTTRTMTLSWLLLSSHPIKDCSLISVSCSSLNSSPFQRFTRPVARTNDCVLKKSSECVNNNK